MNKTLHACGIESRPRWLELDNYNHKYFRKMCSNCGEIINKRKAPDYCPNCKEKMLKEIYNNGLQH